MKVLKDSLFVILCFAFVVACQNTSTAPEAGDYSDSGDDDSKEVEQVLNAEDTISRDTFNAWKSRWASLHTQYMDSTTIEYFDVPLIDLEEVLDENATTSYFYMGLEKVSNGNYLPHMMIVGVNQTTPDYSLILDYTASCPPYCN